MQVWWPYDCCLTNLRKSLFRKSAVACELWIVAAWPLFEPKCGSLATSCKKQMTQIVWTHSSSTQPLQSVMSRLSFVWCSSWAVTAGIEGAEAVTTASQQEKPTVTASQADKPAPRNVSAAASDPAAATAVPSAPAAAPAASVSTMHRFFRKVKMLLHAWCSAFSTALSCSSTPTVKCCNQTTW